MLYFVVQLKKDADAMFSTNPYFKRVDIKFGGSQISANSSCSLEVAE